MASPLAPEPVKLIVAALWADRHALERATAAMREAWGEIDHQGPDRPFDVTGYYRAEMGENLRRRILSFAALISPETIVQSKLAAIEVESELATPAGRRVNLDVGYLDHNKVVLASVKPAGQKIYLGGGVHADLMLRYAGGHLRPFEWTFPDFRDHRYEPELLEIRTLYLAQLRSRKPRPDDRGQGSAKSV